MEKKLIDGGTASNTKTQANSLEDIVAEMKKLATILDTRESDKILSEKITFFKLRFPEHYSKISYEDKALLEKTISMCGTSQNQNNRLFNPAEENMTKEQYLEQFMQKPNELKIGDLVRVKFDTKTYEVIQFMNKGLIIVEDTENKNHRIIDSKNILTF